MALDEEKTYELIHDEIHREHGLISNRINWYVTSQSFLVAAFALCGEERYQFPWMRWVIPVIGIFATLLMLISIIAGLIAIYRLCGRQSTLCPNCDVLPVSKPLHWVGMSPVCFGMPLLLL